MSTPALRLPEAVFVCYYCKLEHRQVEARGVHYCPNRFCGGPGAWNERVKHGYQDDPNATPSKNSTANGVSQTQEQADKMDADYHLNFLLTGTPWGLAEDALAEAQA